MRWICAISAHWMMYSFTASLPTLPAAMTTAAWLAAPDPHADGFSRVSMRDRATSAGGGLRISSVLGRGMEVEVRL